MVRSERLNLTSLVAPTITDIDLGIYMDNLNADGASSMTSIIKEYE